MEKSLKEAIAQLKRDPSKPVEALEDGLHLEVRVKRGGSAADVFREIGRWEGETTEELLGRLEDARRAGGTGEVPEL